MNSLTGKRIVLGVTGGVAAYKSADLVRRLREMGAEVKVIMTRGARQFITPLTFQALSGHTVYKEMFDEAVDAAMDHIELARWADLILIAPITADRIARMAHGLADDLLNTVCLATTASIAIAPAMNQQMWLATVTQSNVELLRARGVIILGPGEGVQACGDIGLGRMLEPRDIALRTRGLFMEPVLKGLSVLVTAGPTREAADPVRFLSNASSGKMGYEIARAAVEAGASATLVSGPSALEDPPGVHCLHVTSAREMRDAVMTHLAGKDIFIAAAAVSDYRPIDYAEKKRKKEAMNMALALEPTPDILAQVTALPNPPFAVGFAAETDNVEFNAKQKLKRKSLDMIAANRVGLPDLGFQSDENALQVYWADGHLEIPKASKWCVAHRLLSLIAERYRQRFPTTADLKKGR
uniref:Coenzyme A biosynthesis bifunctional protein CoaBC n=1 Tax=Candidatus Kentrum sp. MB TaxID=2138164 RepID=A0A450X8L8_9GAMM|nr:MAG: phosphopantothenoylcysteine decarboxylase / phosphopantothenate--cysteine ligase [Candidatus Kentron sp. MB]VFK34490.1 MAG: phosphopantothenoylcysteine decarboxylase / phosphopantothenate--cysteine ligase [Candidatus Kentron sp. MB]VFK76783.1 MAG: phosphopantothenoylcysteine decarboxylase / phosphopantothenate--cysteine ligase [Candidatus Kentron sp. MB]